MFCVSLYIILAVGCRSDDSELVLISIKGEELFVEIADEHHERQQGLMFRKSLPENRGMLFVFDEEDYRSFWMRNTRIPLSLAYIHADGTISEIVVLHPFDERPLKSKSKVKYALEVNKGWFEKYGIRQGERIIVPKLNTQIK